jgi:hypothetical protein
MKSRSVRRIACYKEGVALAYCEVSLWEVTPDTLPVLYNKHSTVMGAYGVNIFDDIFTAFQITSELSYRDIEHNDVNKVLYRASACAHRYVAENGRSIDIQVPHTCGCGIYPCDNTSNMMYCIFTTPSEINVLSVDRLPWKIYTKALTHCATVLLANLMHDIAQQMLRKHADRHIVEFVLEKCGKGPLFRLCNAKFLNRVSLDYFKAYVLSQLYEDTE